MPKVCGHVNAAVIYSMIADEQSFSLLHLKKQQCTIKILDYSK